jgi:hypothetical protein
MKRSRYFWVGQVLVGGGRCGRNRGFDSHKLDYGFSFLLFLICLFCSFVLLFFSFFLFSSFPLSSYQICIFVCFIFVYFIFVYCIFSKMQHAWTVCIPSGRCFIEQKGYEAIQVFFERDKCWYAMTGGRGVRRGIRGRGGIGVRNRGFDSHQLNCAFFLFPYFLFSYFLIFLFSYFLISLFSCFPLSSYQIYIFVYFIFIYFIFVYFIF